MAVFPSSMWQASVPLLRMKNPFRLAGRHAPDASNACLEELELWAPSARGSFRARCRYQWNSAGAVRARGSYSALSPVAYFIENTVPISPLMVMSM